MQQPLGFGGAPLGNLFAAIAEEAAMKLVRRAFDGGIRYFDTAPHYGNGLSEHRIGAALRALTRDDYVLSTKVGRLLVPDSSAPRDQNGYVDVLPFVQRWDYSREGTLRSVDDSLQRLGLARIDYVFIHDVARDAHGDSQPARFREAMEGAVPALAELKAEGVIEGFGLGVNDWQVCVDALAHADLDLLLLAGRYTLLDQTALPELLPLCVARGTRVVLGGPFNSGILATGTQPADGRPSGSTTRRRAAKCSRGRDDRSCLRRAPRAAQGSCAAVSPRASGDRVRSRRRSLDCGARRKHRACVRTDFRAFWRDLRSRGLVAPAAPLPCDTPR